MQLAALVFAHHFCDLARPFFHRLNSFELGEPFVEPRKFIFKIGDASGLFGDDPLPGVPLVSHGILEMFDNGQ